MSRIRVSGPDSARGSDQLPQNAVTPRKYAEKLIEIVPVEYSEP